MGQAPDAIREDIEATRARMGERAEALAYKSDVPARTKDKVTDVTDRIKDKVTGMGQTLTGTTRSTADSVSDATHSAAGSVSSTAHAASDQVSDTAHRAKGLAESNPLGLAVGAIALGFLAGLALPASRAEVQHLGPVADKARDRAREVGQEAAGRAREVARTTEQAVKEQAHA